MARGRSRLWQVATAVTAGAMLVSACEAPTLPRGGGQAATQAQPTVSARTSASQSRAMVDVRRTTITDSIKVLGRVVSSQEADLYFKSPGRLRGLFTESGQQVNAGQVLAELETGDLATRIAKGKNDLENAQLKLEQARVKTAGGLDDKGQIGDTASEEASVGVAQINLDQARLQAEKLHSGVKEEESKSAEADLAKAVAGLETARLGLAKSESDLAAKQADLGFKLVGASVTDLAKAQGDLDTARIKWQQVSAGPRPEDVQAAELKTEQARTKLAQLRDAPLVARPEEIANAELAVRQAEIKLQEARSAQASSGTPAQREARTKAAELDVETARNKLGLLTRQQVSPWEIRLAEQEVAAAENQLAKIKNVQPFDAQAARVTYDLAVARWEHMQRGPTEQDLAPLRAQIAALELAVESARAAGPSAEASVVVAQAKRDAVLRGPSEFELREAAYKVDLAQNQLDTARAKLDVKRAALAATRSSGSYDVQALGKAVEKAQLDLAQFQANFDDARIVAPFDGKITKVNGKPGDSVQAFSPVVSISSPAQMLVRAEVTEADMPKLSVGQRALITLDAFPGQVLNGTVRDLPSSVVTQQGVVADKSTKIVVNWARPGADIGMPTRVQIVVQKKDDVLVVPTNAIRTVGKRRFVEYMDGNVKRSRNVEIGISTDVDTEIVSGVEDGMSILAGG